MVFEVADLVADGRLGKVEFFGGEREAFQARSGFKAAQEGKVRYFPHANIIYMIFIHLFMKKRRLSGWLRKPIMYP